jgi:hypothetical protein
MAPSQSKCRRIGYATAATVLLLCPEISRADEGGVSFWLPGQYASLAATPQVPGWALGVVYYHSNVSAFGNVAAARQITVGRIPANVNVNLNLSLSGQGDLVVLSQPILSQRRYSADNCPWVWRAGSARAPPVSPGH